MLNPRKVKFWAMKKETENIEFRTFLKINANEEELDQQFQNLHKEFFLEYDCNKCRNCCKQYAGTIPQGDVERDAEHFGMNIEEFETLYLKESDEEGMRQTTHVPCNFLQDDGTCKLGDCKPENCKKYPYTDQPERLYSLYSVLEAVGVCPVAYEIYERLKELYNFHYRL